MSEFPNSNNNDNDLPPSTPRWVKVSGIIAIVLVLLVVIIMFLSGGNHGPGRHMPMEEPAKQIEQEATEKNASSDDGHIPFGGGHL